MRLMIAGALLLSGCTTMTELRSLEPRATYSSTRSLPALEQCIAEGLSWAARPTIVRGEKDTSITFGASVVAVMVTLRPTEAGTEVKVMQAGMGYGKRVRRSVERCLR